MIRVLGVDDGYFPERRGRAPLLGILMRGTLVEGVLYREIQIDGTDVTEKLVDMVARSKYGGQAKAVMTSGTVFAGTNVLDMNAFFEEAGVPVIAVMRRPPSSSFLRAMERSPNADFILSVIRRNPPPVPLKTKRGVLYVSFVGIGASDVKRVVEDYQIYSLLPEPVRLAHLFASAVGMGESRGRP